MHPIRRILRRFNIDLVRLKPATSIEHRRNLILKNLNIDLLLDVGANVGRYSQTVRQAGYKGQIVSFEPLLKEFATLSREAARDARWECLSYALGDTDSTTEIYVAGNSESSSLLQMLDTHVKNCPSSAYVGTEKVNVTRLDSIGYTGNIYLKIDTQGYEMKVLTGAYRTLPYIQAIELEMSLVPLYEGEILFREMYDYLDSMGFGLVSVYPGFSSPTTGYLLQFDAIFSKH